MVGQNRLNADGDIICYTLVASVTKRMRVSSSSSSLVYVKDRYTQVSVLPVMLAHTTWPCQDPAPMGESQVFIREGWRPLLKMFNLPTTLPKKNLGSRHPRSPRLGQIGLNRHGGLVPCTLVAWVNSRARASSSSVSRKNLSSCACSKQAVRR